MSKFLDFVRREEKLWVVMNRRHDFPLGFIYFYTVWGKWVFEPHDSTVYDSECLRDIADFIKGLGGGSSG